jgi:hypothetical protein
MTYNELATLCGCDSTDVRLWAMHLALDRKRSRDGITRLKLNPALMAKFFETIKETDAGLDVAISDLKQTYRQMARLLDKGRAA